MPRCGRARCPILTALLDTVAVNLEKSFGGESDLPRECDNLERMGRLLQFNDKIRVPAVHRDHSGNEILTMEFVPTLAISDLVEMDEDSAELQTDLKSRLISTYLAQTFIYRFLHGDFHGKNVGIDEEGRFVLYDLGQMVDLHGRLVPPLKLMLGALIHSPRMVAEAVVDLSDHAEPKRPLKDKMLSVFDRSGRSEADGPAKASRATRAELVAELEEDIEKTLAEAYDEAKLERYRELMGELHLPGWRLREELKSKVLGTRSSAADALADGAISAVEEDWKAMDAPAVRALSGKALLALAERRVHAYLTAPEQATRLASLTELDATTVAERFTTLVGAALSEEAKQAGIGRVRRLDALPQEPDVARALGNLWSERSEEDRVREPALVAWFREAALDGLGNDPAVSMILLRALRTVEATLSDRPSDAPLAAIDLKQPILDYFAGETVRARLAYLTGDPAETIDTVRIAELLHAHVSGRLTEPPKSPFSLKRLLRRGVHALGAIPKAVKTELVDAYHRLELELRIRAESGGLTLAGILSRAAGRNELAISAQYFQLGKTNVSFWANWRRLDHRDSRVRILSILREVMILEPLRYAAYRARVPGLIADGAAITGRKAKQVGRSLARSPARRAPSDPSRSPT